MGLYKKNNIIFLVSLVLILGFSSVCFADSTETNFNFDQTIQEKLNFRAEADYKMDSISKLEYFNQKGFKDRNNDGQLTIDIIGTLDLNGAHHLKNGIIYKKKLPLLFRGNDGAKIINGNYEAKSLINVLKKKSEEDAGPMAVMGIHFENLEGAVINTERETLVKNCAFVDIKNTGFDIISCVSTTSNLYIYESNFENIEADVQIIASDDMLRVKDSNIIKCNTSVLLAGGKVKLNGLILRDFESTWVGDGTPYISSESNISIDNSKFINLISLESRFFIADNIYIKNSIFKNWSQTDYDGHFVNGHMEITNSTLESLLVNLDSPDCEIIKCNLNKLDKILVNNIKIEESIVKVIERMSGHNINIIDSNI